MPDRKPLTFDPIAEARDHWEGHWDGAAVMAAATSVVRAQQIIQAHVEEALRPFDLTFARFEALVLLTFSRRGELPLGKMGERLQVHPASITNIIDRLAAQGLVTREPHPTDRRTILARITEEGRRVAEESAKVVAKSQFGLDGLSEREVEQLTRVLAKLRRLRGDFQP